MVPVHTKGLDLKAFPREGLRVGRLYKYAGGAVNHPGREGRIAPRLRPHSTHGAASAELWARDGTPPPSGMLFLRGRGGAGHRSRSNFVSCLEPSHLALQFGGKVFKDPQLLGPALNQRLQASDLPL